MPPQIRTDRTWEVLCHLAAILGMCVIAVPFGNIAGPLLVWLLKRADSSDVDEQGRESLNFQISIGIYLLCIGVAWLAVAAFCLVPVIGMLAWPLAFVGTFASGVLAIGLIIADLVLVIIASFKAGDGIAYEYPFNLRLLR